MDMLTTLMMLCVFLAPPLALYAVVGWIFETFERITHDNNHIISSPRWRRALWWHRRRRGASMVHRPLSRIGNSQARRTGCARNTTA